MVKKGDDTNEMNHIKNDTFQDMNLKTYRL